MRRPHLESIAIGALIGHAWAHQHMLILIGGAVVGVAWVLSRAT